MLYVFLICAVLGGTVFVFQFVLALIGMGADDLDFADDIPDDVDVDFDIADEAPPDIDHGSTWMFGVISFRTVVAALTFFGLSGMAALEANLGAPLAIIIAIACGYGAMLGVHWLMKKLYSLRQDGTVQIQRSVGQQATVYVPIPPKRSGSGKVQIRVQGRIMEYAAMTSEPDKLPTGTRVVVVDVISPTTLSVEQITDSIASTSA